MNQYMVHAEMCDIWRCGSLARAIQARAATERKHAEKLRARILSLEGRPSISNLHPIRINADAAVQHHNDWQAEHDAIEVYREGIRLAVEAGDDGTRELFESILEDEKDHIAWIEAQQERINRMGIQDYLSQEQKD
jgi:bacterioferritin